MAYPAILIRKFMCHGPLDIIWISTRPNLFMIAITWDFSIHITQKNIPRQQLIRILRNIIQVVGAMFVWKARLEIGHNMVLVFIIISLIILSINEFCFTKNKWKKWRSFIFIMAGWNVLKAKMWTVKWCEIFYSIYSPPTLLYSF